MITTMKKYTFLVFHKEYEAFLNELRSLGVVHVSQKAEGVAEDETMQQMLVERKDLQHLVAQGATDQMLSDRSEVLKAIQDTQRLMAEVAVWGSFSKEKLDVLRQQGHALRFFMAPKAQYLQEWGSVVAEKNGMQYFVAVEGVSPIDDILAANLTEVMLEKSADDYAHDLDALNGLLAAADARIEAWKLAQLPEVELHLKELEQKIEWHKVILNTDKLADNALCLLEGFCPEDKVTELNSHLDANHIYYEAVEPTEEDNTPIKLRNNKFTQMFECLTGMYGWPTYGEFDPTPVLAPFYLLFFSMCMGDAGYGLALILFGLMVAKKKINIEMFEGLGPIITMLGVGTAVVGLFLGTFFGMSLYDAVWYPEALKSIIFHGTVAGYDVQMVLAICIGIFHICLAMVIKACCYTKRFGLKETVGTWGWTLLIVGGLSAFLLLTAFSAPALVTKWVMIAIAAVSALGIYVFNTPGRNPLINIGAGLWDTYNMATGVLGDVLSYVRLYALGLAGGMLGGAFNNLGGMVLGDSPTWQWLPFVLILLLGHVLNLAMSALGAFVHPLRLTFVEYFKNAGYEGKGTLYSPFKK